VVVTPTPGPTNTPTPTPELFSISGKIYVRSKVSTSCDYDPAVPPDQPYLDGATTTETSTGNTGVSSVVDGSYTINGVPKNQLWTRQITLSVPVNYAIDDQCRSTNSQSVPNGDTIPNSGNYVSDVTGADWILKSTLNDPWWQTVGGDVGANSGATPNPIIKSMLPSGSMLSESVGSLVSGLLTYGSGLNNINLKGRPFANPNWIAQSQYDETNKEGFTYFVGLTGVQAGTNFCPTLPTIVCNKPAYSATYPTTEYYYQTGLVTINAAWSVASGEKQVYFVDGNLTISQTISVTPGGFLAFIVSGDIIIDPTVAGSAAVPAVQGIYVADGTINTGSGASALYGAGSFIGWTDVDLNRDLGAGNSANPAELFTWRPDLLINAPDEFRRANYEWQEVEP
jgi:hypothetical protein